MKAKLTALFACAALTLCAAEQQIVVNIPSYEISLYEGSTPLFQAPCYVGKETMPTAIGEGEVVHRHPQITFHRLTGPNKGELITESYIAPEGKKVPIPYAEMRGLDYVISSSPVQQIRSTTEYWKMGTAASNGSIGLKVEDMKQLYSLIRAPLPEVHTSYKTVFFNPETEEITIWHDVYHRGTNTVATLYAALQEHGIDTSSLPTATIEANIAAIDRRLESRVERVKESKAQGVAVPEEATLNWTGSLPALTEGLVSKSRAVTTTLGSGGVLYNILRNNQISKQEAGQISKRIEQSIDAKKLAPKDRFTLHITDDVITDITINNRGQTVIVPLTDLHIGFIKNELTNTKGSVR